MGVDDEAEIYGIMREDYAIQECEKPWVERFPYLLSRGYRLDDRYDPDHTPSFLKWNAEDLEGLTCDTLGQFFVACPDALIDFQQDVKGATRTTDGRQVFLKIIPDNTEELAVLRVLSSSPFSSDSHDPAAQLLDYFPLSSDDSIYADSLGRCYLFVVLPLLRDWDWPPHAMVGETLSFIGQVLEGLSFLHQHNIAHGDIRSDNIMMDPSQLFPLGMHPKGNLAIDIGFTFPEEQLHDRVDASPRYLFTDFGSSSMFPTGARGLVTGAGRRSLYHTPEMSYSLWYDPFMADIYQLGCFLREFFAERIPELTPLIQAMLHPDPVMRPTAEYSLQIFSEISSALPRSASLRFMPSRWEDVCREWSPNYKRYMHFMHVATYMRTALKCTGRAREVSVYPAPHIPGTVTALRRPTQPAPAALRSQARLRSHTV